MTKEFNDEKKHILEALETPLTTSELLEESSLSRDEVFEQVRELIDKGYVTLSPSGKWTTTKRDK